MSRNPGRAGTTRSRKKSRRTSLLWIGVAAAVVITLMVLEQVALLYVLATVSVAVLLIVVARADLHVGERPRTENVPYDDSAAIASGTTTPPGAAAPLRTPARSVKGRGRR